MEAEIVVKEVNGTKIRSYAYNGQIPGPVLRVKQGSIIYVNFTNNIDEPTTVHWHGIRLENKYDGVPNITQEEVMPSQSFLYRVDFPDAGVYWYHPHVREDLEQGLGLYGVIIVDPNETDYYDQVNSENVLVLNDMLLNGSDVWPYGTNDTNFALMGRFGNTLLVNGQANYSLSVKKGEVVRFYILDAANVRPFNLSIENTSFKIVGSDGGKYEKDFFSNSVIISPSERYTVEVAFNQSGTFRLFNQNPLQNYTLGEINVQNSNDNNSVDLNTLKENDDVKKSIENYSSYFDTPPNFTYVLTIDIPGAIPMDNITRALMGESKDGIEWEDTMFGMNSHSTTEQARWMIKDNVTGKTNMDAMQTVTINEPIKILIKNDENSEHPMQHSIHLHGAQFLILKTNGVKNDDLVWKDTVLIPSGGSVELLTYFPHEGEWMMHCHIAEHLESGMMTAFNVTG